MWECEADFKTALHHSYEVAKLADFIEPGHTWGSLVWRARESGEISIPESTKIGLAIIDDLLSDAIIWFTSFHTTLIGNDEHERPSPLFLSIFALSLKLTQDSIVVRDLIVKGYDLQARNLVRSIGEHIDAIYYLCLHPDVCAEFIKTEDEETSNLFWYRHLRTARESIDRKLAQIIKDPLVKKFSEFRRNEGQVFSAAHHPSYWACVNSQLIPHSADNIYFNMFGIPSDYSFRTGKFLFNNLAECAIIMPIICKPIGNHIKSLGDDHPFKIFVRRGTVHLITMTFAIIENWNAPVFRLSEELESILKSLPKL